MEWLLSLFERPIDKNYNFFFQFSKFAIWITFASVLYELGTGKYVLIDLSNVLQLELFFESGQFWLCILYFFYALFLYFTSLNCLELIIARIGVFFCEKFLWKNINIMKKAANKTSFSDEERNNILFHLPSTEKINLNNAIYHLEKQLEAFEKIKIILKRCEELFVSVLILQFSILEKNYYTPIFWNFVFYIIILFLIFFSMLFSGVVCVAKSSIEILKKITDRQNFSGGV
jgi:hypothetical protein